MKSLGAVTIGLIALVIAALLLGLYTSDGGPRDAVVRSLAEKEIKARVKGCVVTKISMIRGDRFLSQSHDRAPAYGTPVYPVRVHVIFTPPAKDGSSSESQEAIRMLYLYKNPIGEWVDGKNFN